MPHVSSIAYTPLGMNRRLADRYAREPLDRAELIADHGIAGDAKGRRGKRQLNVMLAETVAELAAEGFRTNPGELGEQLVIAGLDADEVVPSARLRIGDTAVIELVELRTPCDRFERVQGHPVKIAEGRIGFMARVLTRGEIRVNSPVTLLPTQAMMQFD